MQVCEIELSHMGKKQRKSRSGVREKLFFKEKLKKNNQNAVAMYKGPSR